MRDADANARRRHLCHAGVGRAPLDAPTHMRAMGRADYCGDAQTSRRHAHTVARPPPEWHDWLLNATSRADRAAKQQQRGQCLGCTAERQHFKTSLSSLVRSCQRWRAALDLGPTAASDDVVVDVRSAPHSDPAGHAIMYQWIACTKFSTTTNLVQGTVRRATSICLNNISMTAVTNKPNLLLVKIY